ncbi:uncharacterized protein EKO05_0004787 [Ascochyta rabiei]|uniref:Uncharacterized protein n=1 Tax=Didymella rabiei TaxID=5454 RepID=A0A163JJ54_DIDRA|nr:uncharacterized protein EKO05_0004787 [Ascochyta rabiei]KZM26396.1 hypothetical protein ST47_g2477 [Ascochyta rabiei]UPX14299.1 hypothetical protein EKO05_0004787 [Ascochyta rabiei]
MEAATAAVQLLAREQNALNSAQKKNPNWPDPNYVDPETRMPLLIAVTCTSGFVMLVLLEMRMYTRHKMSTRGLGMDDVLMVLAAFFSTALVAIVCVCAVYGTGYHNWDIRPEWYPTWGKATFSQNLAFIPATTLTKLSILHTYLFLFPSRANEIFCRTMMTFLWAWGAIQIIVSCFQCRPLSSYWDISQEEKCILINPYLYSSGAVNSLTDVIVYLWPSRTLFSLQLPLLRRLGLLVTFSAGLVAVLASILRMVSIRNASFSSDSTWEGTFIALWKVLEVTFGVKCGCLPAVKPLIERFLPKSGTDSSHPKNEGYSSNRFNRLENRASHSRGNVDRGASLRDLSHESLPDETVEMTSEGADDAEIESRKHNMEMRSKSST